MTRILNRSCSCLTLTGHDHQHRLPNGGFAVFTTVVMRCSKSTDKKWGMVGVSIILILILILSKGVLAGAGRPVYNTTRESKEGPSFKHHGITAAREGMSRTSSQIYNTTRESTERPNLKHYCGSEMPPPFVYVPALPPESYRGAPILPRAPPPPMYMPVMEPPLSVLIQHQIEYDFSDANLVKDNYLRSNMDEEGWVPVSLIAGFRRVQNLTSDIQMILSCLRDSAVVEVQGETVRRRYDWAKWVQPSPNTNFPADSSSQSLHTAPDGSVIETSLQKLVLDESKTVQDNTTDTNDSHSKEEALDICSSGFTDSLELANGEVTNGDQSINAKSSTSS